MATPLNDQDKSSSYYAFTEVWAELDRAQLAFPTFANPHEGYAVLLEEVDELWEVVKTKQPQDKERLRAEARQVAAMAIRFMLECT